MNLEIFELQNFLIKKIDKKFIKKIATKKTISISNTLVNFKNLFEIQFFN